MWQVKNKFMGLTHVTVFRVHEYCFHSYILTINVQSRFIFYSLLKIHWFLWFIAFYDFIIAFSAFNCANNIGSLINNLFGVYIFNPFLSFSSSSSPSGGGMSGISIN